MEGHRPRGVAVRGVTVPEGNYNVVSCVGLQRAYQVDSCMRVGLWSFAEAVMNV